MAEKIIPKHEIIPYRELRDKKQKDAVKLLHAFYPNGPRSWIEKRLSKRAKGHRAAAIIMGDCVAGIGTIEVTSDVTARIGELMIKPTFEGLGLGGSLLIYLEEEIRKESVDKRMKVELITATDEAKMFAAAMEYDNKAPNSVQRYRDLQRPRV